MKFITTWLRGRFILTLISRQNQSFSVDINVAHSILLHLYEAKSNKCAKQDALAHTVEEEWRQK